MRPLALLAVLAACASRPPADVEFWVPPDASETTRAAVTEALAGHPPPRADRLPRCAAVRQVRYLLEEPPDWRTLVELSRSHARDIGADAVVLVDDGGPPHTRPAPDPIWGDLPPQWIVTLALVRYR